MPDKDEATPLPPEEQKPADQQPDRAQDLDEDCLFCRIVRQELPAEVVFHDQDILAFYDIHPKAPVHIQIIPRQHIASVAELEKGDQFLIGNMVWVAKYLAESHRLTDGYKLLINTGAGAGQTVPHLHLHLLGGQRMAEIITAA